MNFEKLFVNWDNMKILIYIKGYILKLNFFILQEYTVKLIGDGRKFKNIHFSRVRAYSL